MFVPYVVVFVGALHGIAVCVGLGRLVSSFPAPVVVGVVNAMVLLTLALQLRYTKDFLLTPSEVANGWNVAGTAPSVEVLWNILLFSFFGPGFEWISPSLTLVIYAIEVATAFVISLY